MNLFFTTRSELERALKNAPGIRIELTRATDQGSKDTPAFIEAIADTREHAQAAIDLGGDYHRENYGHVVTFHNKDA